VDWERAEEFADLASFTAAVSEFRRAHPVFRRRRFFAGRPAPEGDRLRDIVWFSAKGREMTDEDWGAQISRSVMVFLNGNGIPDLDARGEPVIDSSFLLGFNAAPEDVTMKLPGKSYGKRWAVVLDTAGGEVPAALGALGGVTSLGPLGNLTPPLGAVSVGNNYDLMEGARVVEAKATLKVTGRSLVVLQRTEPNE
jgi:isoamylase